MLLLDVLNQLTFAGIEVAQLAVPAQGQVTALVTGETQGQVGIVSPRTEKLVLIAGAKLVTHNYRGGCFLIPIKTVAQRKTGISQA